MSGSGSHLSKEFFDLVKAIGESRSKQEEDRIILREVDVLKGKMATKDTSEKKMKEYLIRMIYVEMLGHDATFGHVYAVNHAQTAKNLLSKRVGYLAVTLTLHPGHDFMYLLVATIQRDLKSDNFVVVSMALGVVCKLVSQETMQPLLPLVMDLLKHSQALVRKKTVMCLHRFLIIDKTCLEQYNEQVRRIICDKDPSVMAASLNLFAELSKDNPVPYKDLIPSFVSILKQVTEARLPRDYDYHRIPAPWVQLKILEILGLLGSADKRNSEGMYSILHEVMKRADVGINVGYAIVYECVRTVTAIYPDKALLEDASLSIARFITSENHNLKYLGVNSLASIVQIDPKYAAEHQLTVIDCLEDPDETLRRKTLDLLYRMTNGANVKLVVEKLLISLEQATDLYLKSELASRINTLAEKFAPDNEWYVTTMTQVFELGGTLAKHEWAHNLLKLIAERAEEQGADGGEEEAEDIRVYAVEAYLELLEGKKVLPDLLVQVIAWVLGEYGRMSISASPEEITTHLVNLLSKSYEDDSTRAWLLSALEKFVASNESGPEMPPSVDELIRSFQKSSNLDLQQRAHEFLELAKNPNTMAAVLPRDKFLEDGLTVDAELSFLNGYVQAALAAGAKAYMSREKLAEMMSAEEKDVLGHRKQESGLKFDAYEAAVVEPNTVSTSDTGDLFPVSDSSGADDSDPLHTPSLEGSLSAKAGPWGPTGYAGDSKQPKLPEPASQNSFSSASSSYSNQPTATTGGGEGKGLWNQQSGQDNSAQSAADDLANLQMAAVNTASHIHNTLYNPRSSNDAYVPKVDDRLQQNKKEYDPKMMGLFANTSASKPKQQKSLLERRREAAEKRKSGAGGSSGVLTPQKQKSSQPSPSPTQPLSSSPPGALPAPIQQQPRPAVEQKTQQTDGDDIMGMAFSQPARSQSPPSEDLFGGVFGDGETKAAASVSSSSQHAGADLLDDLLDFGGPSSATTTAAAASVSIARAIDLFGGGPAEVVGEFQTGPASIDPTMRANLEKLAGGPLPTQDNPLLSNSFLHISFIPLVTVDRTVAVLMITNKAIAPSSLSMQFTVNNCPPTAVNLGFDGEPKPQVGPNNSLQMVLPSRKTAVLLIMVQAKAIGAATLSGITCSGSAQFTVPLSLLHLVRPMQMNTQQFSGYWKSCPHESRATVPGVRMSSVAFMQKAQTIMKLFAVQTIGHENIVAGKLVGLNNVVCLLHANVSNGLVIVHSQDPAFSAALLAACQSVYRS
eukprot:gb/GEZN01000644.1/.p1 GENE.gb/GEZN01000644.1/~~gb/GEZN01000644.1/.p1  ORF type:complete len:1245 (-),score=250.73 gb/GEZN01000644.1/:124-3858(-)